MTSGSQPADVPPIHFISGFTPNSSAFSHIKILEYLGVTALPVGKAETLKQLDGLIIPGGESTTVGKLMQRYELAQPIQELARQGMPIFGTCAGMILLAQRVVNDEVPTLGLLDMTVQRNGFGRPQ